MKKNSIKSLILPVSNIAIHAGVIINKYYKSKLKFSLKKDNSPLTKADISSNNYIINSLSILDPKIPIFSEESNVPWKIRKKWTHIFKKLFSISNKIFNLLYVFFLNFS